MSTHATKRVKPGLSMSCSYLPMHSLSVDPGSLTVVTKFKRLCLAVFTLVHDPSCHSHSSLALLEGAQLRTFLRSGEECAIDETAGVCGVTLGVLYNAHRLAATAAFCWSRPSGDFSWPSSNKPLRSRHHSFQYSSHFSRGHHSLEARDILSLLPTACMLRLQPSRALKQTFCAVRPYNRSGNQSPSLRVLMSQQQHLRNVELGTRY